VRLLAAFLIRQHSRNFLLLGSKGDHNYTDIGWVEVDEGAEMCSEQLRWWLSVVLPRGGR
jgi:hypothetical protein